MSYVGERIHDLAHPTEPTEQKTSKKSRLRALADEAEAAARSEHRYQQWRTEWDELQIAWDDALLMCTNEVDRIATNLAFERACKSLAERRPR